MPKATSTPAAGDELAQGTPVEPASPAVGDLVVHGDRVGFLVATGRVAWLGPAERVDLPLRKLGG